jgi:hypothetical protein
VRNSGKPLTGQARLIIWQAQVNQSSINFVIIFESIICGTTKSINIMIISLSITELIARLLTLIAGCFLLIA